MRPRFNTPKSIQPGHIRACSLPGRSENRLKNVAGAGGNHEVAGLGHEVRGGTREGFGEDSARLRRHETVVFTVPDLHRHLDLVQRDIPTAGFERVIVRHPSLSLPERLRHASAQSLSDSSLPVSPDRSVRACRTSKEVIRVAPRVTSDLANTVRMATALGRPGGTTACPPCSGSLWRPADHASRSTRRARLAHPIRRMPSTCARVFCRPLRARSPRIAPGPKRLRNGHQLGVLPEGEGMERGKTYARAIRSQKPNPETLRSPSKCRKVHLEARTRIPVEVHHRWTIGIAHLGVPDPRTVSQLDMKISRHNTAFGTAHTIVTSWLRGKPHPDDPKAPLPKRRLRHSSRRAQKIQETPPRPEAPHPRTGERAHRAHDPTTVSVFAAEPGVAHDVRIQDTRRSGRSRT